MDFVLLSSLMKTCAYTYTYLGSSLFSVCTFSPVSAAGDTAKVSVTFALLLGKGHVWAYEETVNVTLNYRSGTLNSNMVTGQERLIRTRLIRSST